MKIKDTGKHGLVPEHKQGHTQDNAMLKNFVAVADYDDPYTQNTQESVNEEEATNEEAIVEGNCAKLVQSVHKEHLIKPKRIFL